MALQYLRYRLDFDHQKTKKRNQEQKPTRRRDEQTAADGGATEVVYSLVIINKAGGLIYQRDFQAGLQKLSTNDYLVFAGTFHGVHAITRSLTPVFPYSAPATSNTSASTIPMTSTLPNPGLPKTGLEVLDTERFRLTCFQTVTGTKFLLFTDPLMPNVDSVIAKIYELYADYVMKNPFYQLEMPVRCESFDRHLATWLRGR
ncbi:sybindin-like family protein [Trichophyton tonsurans CBS 112818]|uniref:Trafficking protein particle complex subunit n=1 Tax=Trichophyton tonsurans (strain CBS 112818) TaxID=647933 RepID=F2RXZ4_TRIT1|nr:sybindin-like family protein [Trichophyton tonsurans CBS 112818]